MKPVSPPCFSPCAMTMFCAKSYNITPCLPHFVRSSSGCFEIMGQKTHSGFTTVHAQNPPLTSVSKNTDFSHQPSSWEFARRKLAIQKSCLFHCWSYFGPGPNTAAVDNEGSWRSRSFSDDHLGFRIAPMKKFKLRWKTRFKGSVLRYTWSSYSCYGENWCTIFPDEALRPEMVKSLLVSPAWRFSSGALHKNEQIIFSLASWVGHTPSRYIQFPQIPKPIIWILWALK